jgi:peptidyl-prolyl cis-trans isomerase C
VNKRIALLGLILATTISCGQKGAQPSPSPASSPAAGNVAPAVKPVPSPLPEVVAEVNGQPVSSRFLKTIVESQVESGQIPPERRDVAYRGVLDNLITREVLFQEASARKTKVQDRAVRQAYDQPRAQFSDELQWNQHLAKQGFTPETFRAEIRIQQTVRALLSEVADQVKAKDLSDSEIRAYYESHSAEFDAPERLEASHILVAVAAKADAATRARLHAKAKAILERARKGADFAQLARESSDDPGSAKGGGRLPAFGRGKMVKPFEEAAFALKPGETSGLVETPYGYHIIKLHKRLAAEHLAMEAVAEQLRSFLLQQKRQLTVQQFVAQLRAKAKIDIKI